MHKLNQTTTTSIMDEKKQKKSKSKGSTPNLHRKTCKIRWKTGAKQEITSSFPQAISLRSPSQVQEAKNPPFTLLMEGKRKQDLSVSYSQTRGTQLGCQGFLFFHSLYNSLVVCHMGTFLALWVIWGLSLLNHKLILIQVSGIVCGVHIFYWPLQVANGGSKVLV